MLTGVSYPRTSKQNKPNNIFPTNLIFICFQNLDEKVTGFSFKQRKDRKTERQKDRKTERQKDRKTERQKDRKTERQKDRKTKKQKDTKTEA